MKIIIALLLLASGLFAADRERPDIDPAVQGVWTAISVSRDGGATSKDMPDVVIARARAASIVLSNGNTMTVDKVVVSNTKAGEVGNIIKFANSGVVYAISNSTIQGVYLLQVFNTIGTPDGQPEETARFLVRVSQ